MRRVTIFLLAICCCVFLTLNHAGAALYTATQDQTADGQDFTFTFSDIAMSDGTDGFFYITARGDYFGGSGSENLDFNIDDIFSVFNIGRSDVHIIDNESDHILWEGTWTIPGEDLLAITSDTDGVIFVGLYTGVGVKWNHEGEEYVSVTLGYNEVPVPSAVLLLGGGLIGLIGIRRKVRC